MKEKKAWQMPVTAFSPYGDLVVNEYINEGDQEEYQKFFAKKLDKYGVKSPKDLSKEDSEKMYAEIEKEWTKDESIEEETEVSYYNKKKKVHVYTNISTARKIADMATKKYGPDNVEKEGALVDIKGIKTDKEAKKLFDEIKKFDGSAKFFGQQTESKKDVARKLAHAWVKELNEAGDNLSQFTLNWKRRLSDEVKTYAEGIVKYINSEPDTKEYKEKWQVKQSYSEGSEIEINILLESDQGNAAWIKYLDSNGSMEIKAGSNRSEMKSIYKGKAVLSDREIAKQIVYFLYT